MIWGFAQRAMPRSFLVKRGGLHHLRQATRIPSPGPTPATFGQLGQQTVSWETSLEDSRAEKTDTKTVPIVLLQRDIQTVKHSGGNGYFQPLSPTSNGG